jgi:hypothetical protein
MLGCLLHAPRGPFYSPKAARSRWRQPWKDILAFCRVVHRTVTVAVRCAISFLFWRTQPLVLRIGWRTGQSGVPNQSLLRATRRPQIARPTVALATVGSPDSPVHHRIVSLNYSHVAPLLFPRATSSPRMTHQTVRCTTGRSGEL